MSFQNISHHLYGITVQQRVFDGYINATHLCKANHEKTGELKKTSEWLSNDSVQSAIEKLAEVEEVSTDKLVEVKKGRNGGTWIHPRLAVRFAMWLNDDFSLQVEDWVQQWTTWKITPVQLAFSELRELTEIVDVSIKATQMIHTAAHGLTAILNMARRKLYAIRENQANTFASNDLYYKQVNGVEERIYELADKIYNLYSMNPEYIELLDNNTINLTGQEIQDFSDHPDNELAIIQESYKEIKEEAEFLQAKEEALLKSIVSRVGVALGPYGQESNRLEFQAVRKRDEKNGRDEITVYAYEWGKQVACNYTFNTYDYPGKNEYNYYIIKTSRRSDYCRAIHYEIFGKTKIYYQQNSSIGGNTIARVVEEVLENGYYSSVLNAQSLADLEIASKLLPDNIDRSLNN